MSPRRRASRRTHAFPALDLDSVYGQGPVADALLYSPRDRVKFRVESSGLFEDLPRTSDGSAIIADPRNDEHVILAGLHAVIVESSAVCPVFRSLFDLSGTGTQTRVPLIEQEPVMTRKLSSMLGLAAVAMLIGAGRGTAALPSNHEVAPRNLLAVKVPAPARAKITDNVFGVLLEDGTFAHYFNY